MEKVERLNTLSSRHGLEDSILVETVNRHAFVDVAGDLLVGLNYIGATLYSMKSNLSLASLPRWFLVRSLRLRCTLDL